MKISGKRETELYASISGPITDTRIRMARSDSSGNVMSAQEFDARLFELERDIWGSVCTALNIERNP